MIIPNRELTSVGAFMAPLAILHGFGLLFGAQSAARALIGCALIVGVLANFTLFHKLPPWARALSIAAPWAPFIVFAHLQRQSHVDWSMILLAYPFFYPWALGIAFIHGARLIAHDGSGSRLEHGEAA